MAEGGEAARLSKLLFEARELLQMGSDVVESRTHKPDHWGRRVITEIDIYRAERGWSPHGFGGEEEVVDASPPSDAPHVERPGPS